MVSRRKTKYKPIIGLNCEVSKLKAFFSEFELVCDYRYVRAIIRAGGVPVLVPINPKKRDLGRLLDRLDGLVMVGGADIHPGFYGERDRHRLEPMYRGRTKFDMTLYRMAARRRLPILAICYGTQLINVAHGGTLHQDIQKQIRQSKNHRSKRNPFHSVMLDPNSHLAKIFGKSRFHVHSEHHQSVKKLGKSFRAVGWSPDAVIEAIEGPPRVLAVQWHPERQEKDPVQRKLFRSFITLCKSKKTCSNWS
jgi:gamma-glutamyl-gamma-aminobutyrate hydrolase PuuD